MSKTTPGREKNSAMIFEEQCHLSRSCSWLANLNILLRPRAWTHCQVKKTLHLRCGTMLRSRLTWARRRCPSAGEFWKPAAESLRCVRSLKPDPRPSATGRCRHEILKCPDIQNYRKF